ncbi:hypothetical protein [Mammaliicoccus sciuri]|uniref:hypothetical protein n=1 Tax=Mammaliicoccus sciuri TaxID=1296 RepID=UPI003A8EE155
MTRVFLAGTHGRDYVRQHAKPPYLLDSYYYLKKATDTELLKTMQYIKSDHCKMFLLDSGAFTYMEQAKKAKGKTTDNYELYVREYAKFINKWDIQYFFKMDIDVIVGIEKVEEYRRLLERLTGKQCVPVFHLSRGKDYWLKMIKEYDFVAIGGLANKSFPQNKYPYLKWFIKTAHEHGTKIHGLGFTKTSLMKEYTFDSVDSTTWVNVARFGEIKTFRPKEGVIKAMKKPPNARLTNTKDAEIISAKEWIKFTRYIEKQNKLKVLGGW